MKLWGISDKINGFITTELFKIFLDAIVFNSPELTRFLEPRPESPTEVANWSYLYIRSLIKYAIGFIGNALREELHDPAVEIQLLMHCVLSTPTTWDANTITTFGFIAERAICDARKNHTYASSLKTIRVNITEPDAVANYVLHHRMAPLSHGDNLLVVDVGGSTSDFCLCQVAEIYGHYICLVLDRDAPIRGISSGCIDIDRTFQLRVMERFFSLGASNTFNLAMQMKGGTEFQQRKISYLGPQQNTGTVSFAVPGWSSVATYEQAQIIRGRMILWVPLVLCRNNCGMF